MWSKNKIGNAMMQDEMQKVKILLIFSGTKSGAVTLFVCIICIDYCHACSPISSFSILIERISNWLFSDSICRKGFSCRLHYLPDEFCSDGCVVLWVSPRWRRHPRRRAVLLLDGGRQGLPWARGVRDVRHYHQVRRRGNLTPSNPGGSLCMVSAYGDLCASCSF